MKKVFIDGSAGTTGLRIRERLAQRHDLEVVTLPEEVRKDIEARRAALNAADVAFLCLPDAAAVEAVGLVENPNTVVIDTSTAHRTAEGWEYGFPELAGRRARIAQAKRIANPGCHASGFIALVEPLVRAGLVAADERLCAFSLTGYSGGGKKMIAEYEGLGGLGGLDGLAKPSKPLPNPPNFFLGGRQYALGQAHKHLPEMAKVCGLKTAPCFSPIVVPHLSGMEVTVQLFDKDLAAIKDCYRSYYGLRDQGLIAPPANGVLGVSASPLADRSHGASGVSASPLADRICGLVRFVDDPAATENGFLSSAALAGKDTLEVSVYGNGERVLLVARFDNLGKGASGAAIQNMNVVLGVDESTGLVV